MGYKSYIKVSLLIDTSPKPRSIPTTYNAIMWEKEAYPSRARASRGTLLWRAVPDPQAPHIRNKMAKMSAKDV